MKNTGMFIAGMLAGAAVGTAAALLFAPQKGSETRDQLKAKLSELETEMAKAKDKLKEKSGGLRNDLKDKIHSLELRIEKLLNEYKSSLEPTSTSTVN